MSKKSGKCCDFPQYCEDCLLEQEAQVEDFEEIPTSSGNSKNFSVSGERLFYNGMSFAISGKKEKGPNVKFYTEQGFVFYARQNHEKLVFIKVMRFKGKGRKPDPEIEECCKLLIGKIPSGLLNENW